MNIHTRFTKKTYRNLKLQAIVKVRHDINQRFYGTKPSVVELMDGTIQPPPAAKPLYDKLREYTNLMLQKEHRPWPAGGEGLPAGRYQGSATAQQQMAALGRPGSVYEAPATQPEYHFSENASNARIESAAGQRFFEAQQRQNAYQAAGALYQSATPEQRRQAASLAASGATLAVTNAVPLATGAPDDVFV